MTLNIRIPRALAVCLFLSLHLFASSATAQNAATAENSTVRPRRTSVTTLATGVPTLSTDPVIVSVAEENDDDAAPMITAAPKLKPSLFFGVPAVELDQMLLAAIDTRIGARYVWGASGPHVFDCSGFVWSVFRSAGVEFERSNARSLWSRFQPAAQEERYRFGTLVFFNNLQHVGIVADERGFYHASRSHGVTYSTFEGYWGERVDGFRSIPQAVFAD